MKTASTVAPAAAVTRSEFAAMKGWAPSYVTKLIAQQRLVLTADRKLVDVAASNRRLEETKRVDRQGVREHFARKRGKDRITPPAVSEGAVGAEVSAPAAPAESGPVGASATPPAPPPESDQDAAAYNKARAQKEAAAAAMAEIALAQRRGELVEIGQVREMAARIAGIIGRGFERIAPRIGPVWSTEAEPAKRERLLEDELRKVQAEWADEVAKLLEAGDA